ncbi:methenyltetrahydromethanopterin cyclohydrolase [Desulfosporosinus sp. FKB]|uniref:methenyltetrahydromethanopterin cyclohydrolase n=1 Tax=Desulfosporosinus sp. FKB TaxID=1969835 RepID=UPI000B49FA5B|nr:methenyltetrahydromethanopterin cyclohydrolase [Desulfosporosinus sp. FKB]
MPLPLIQHPELSPNSQAFPFVEQLLTRNKQLGTNVTKSHGVTIIDCGIQVLGGWEAGVLYASVCLGGLARVELHWSHLKDFPWPSVEVITDHPLRACLASQYAGWPIKNGEKVVLGSGPIRSIVHEGGLFETLGYRDESNTAIICLESDTLPTDEAIEQILEVCNCAPTSLYILAAPTASFVGSVQVSARALETGLSKLRLLGYDLGKIVSGWSTCPLPPITKDNLRALGRTNDAILYGATVYFNLQDDDKTLESIVKQIPSSLSQYNVQRFEELIERHGNFYELDPTIFSPAEVWLNNINSGNSFHAGAVNINLLRQSFCIKA